MFMPALPVQADDERPLVVVELFTSQGCNSCPPADRLLGELIQRDDVLGFSFHVDYWDYIGWQDTFALPISRTRQHSYVENVGGRYVYTPQLVIGGREQVVGHDKAAVEAAIAANAARPMVHVSSHPTGGKGKWVVNVDPADIDGTATVWMVTFDSRHDVDIRRGENGGRTLRYFNVVREVHRISDSWDGTTPLKIDVDMGPVWQAGHDNCAVIVQRDGYGPILGAARVVKPAT